MYQEKSTFHNWPYQSTSALNGGTDGARRDLFFLWKIVADMNAHHDTWTLVNSVTLPAADHRPPPSRRRPRGRKPGWRRHVAQRCLPMSLPHGDRRISIPPPFHCRRGSAESSELSYVKCSPPPSSPLLRPLSCVSCPLQALHGCACRSPSHRRALPLAGRPPPPVGTGFSPWPSRPHPPVPPGLHRPTGTPTASPLSIARTCSSTLTTRCITPPLFLFPVDRVCPHSGTVSFWQNRLPGHSLTVRNGDTNWRSGLTRYPGWCSHVSSVLLWCSCFLKLL